MDKIYIAVSNDDKNKIALILKDQYKIEYISSKSKLEPLLINEKEPFILHTFYSKDILPYELNNYIFVYGDTNEDMTKYEDTFLIYKNNLDDLLIEIKEKVLKKMNDRDAPKESSLNISPSLNHEQEEINPGKPVIINNDFPEESSPEVLPKEAANEDKRSLLAMNVYEESYKHKRNNKVIGVWSPQHAVGVTTFIINFAIYMKKICSKQDFMVIEAVSLNPTIRQLLEKYKSRPNKWHSIIEVLNEESDLPFNSCGWPYKGIEWSPRSNNDYKVKLDEKMVSLYLNTPNDFRFVFVDLPNGKMAPYTLEALKHIDELWIMVDNNFQRLEDWRTYIQTILSDKNLKAKLIFSKYYDFSDKIIKSIQKSLDLPCLGSIPPMLEEIEKNHLQTSPLIEFEENFIKLEPYYWEIAKYIIDNYGLVENELINNKGIFQKYLRNIKKSFFNNG